MLTMIRQPVVPKYSIHEFQPKKNKYCLCIPIINENTRIQSQLKQAQDSKIDLIVDIIICDGGSTDGSTDKEVLDHLGVNTLLTKEDVGKQGAQLRMGFWWALERGYEGVITIDGNNKDSIQSVNLFIEKLEQGFDFIQGSRFVNGGAAINTPLIRHLAVKYIHAPLISKSANFKYTDTTNAFRGYSKKYLLHPEVNPFRDVFVSYELLAYLSIRAPQLGFRVCEVPVKRSYPKNKKTPTKISPFKGNISLFTILIKAVIGCFNP